MAYTPDQIAALQAAIALGAKKVKYADKEVDYRSLQEMRDLLAEMLAETGAAPARERRKYYGVSSGNFPT